jgi:hypothetical protein
MGVVSWHEFRAVQMNDENDARKRETERTQQGAN